jgi:hypothetical protein
LLGLVSTSSSNSRKSEPMNVISPRTARYGNVLWVSSVKHFEHDNVGVCRSGNSNGRQQPLTAKRMLKTDLIRKEKVMQRK